MTNLHWAITASDEKHKLPTGGYSLHQIVDIQIRHSDSEKEAIKRAKQIIKRKWFFLRSVVECDCAKHAVQYRKTLEMSQELNKAIKKQLGSEDE